MEEVIEEGLSKGLEMHVSGQFETASKLYESVIMLQPKHPDANHNMGVLAVGLGKVQEALPFLKTALEANPSESQYWLSYIDALVKLDQLADAKAVLHQAKSKGAKGEAFDTLEKQLTIPDDKPVEPVSDSTLKVPSQSNILDTLKLDQAVKRSGDVRLACHLGMGGAFISPASPLSA
jgi:protein O-GlcNAc transferase